jgi:hypothetical protein
VKLVQNVSPKLIRLVAWQSSLQNMMPASDADHKSRANSLEDKSK